VSLSLLLSVCAAAEARADVDLWPFLELSDRQTTVMYPFYVHEGDFMMVFPAYYRTNEGHDHHVLWPLAKHLEQKGRMNDELALAAIQARRDHGERATHSPLSPLPGVLRRVTLREGDDVAVRDRDPRVSRLTRPR
jgi:hypothetical protein